MKGLLIKDFLSLSKQVKTMGILVIFYMVFSFSTKNASMLSIIIMLFCSMLPITTLSYDEYSKWDKYALSMPISRKTLVISKYFLGLLLCLIGLVLLTLFSFAYSILIVPISVTEFFITVYIAIGISIFFLSTVLPLIFKFGVEKSRLLMMAVIVVPSALCMIIPNLNLPKPDEKILELIGNLLIFGTPFVLILLLVISIFISIKIYSKREF